MTKKLFALLFLAGTASGQWADFSSLTGSSNLSGAMNGKPTVQIVSGVPTGSCTDGKDLAVDTTAVPGVPYFCSGGWVAMNGVEIWTVGTGGVTANTLVQMDNTASPSKIVAATTGVYGVALSTVTATNLVAVARYGFARCVVDTSNSTNGHLVLIGTGTVIDCKDSSQTQRSQISMGTQVVGVFRESVTAGAGATALVELLPGHFGTKVDTINAASVPASAALIATNGSSQAIAAPLSSGNMFVGNGSSLPVGVAMSQDCALSNAGAITCTKSNNVTLSYLATATAAVNAQTATYQVLAADFSNEKTISVASGTFTITLVASGSQPTTGQKIHVVNYGSGVVTIARSGQNINGGVTSLTLPASTATAPNGATITSDGTNYIAALMNQGSASGASPGGSSGDVQVNSGSSTFAAANLNKNSDGTTTSSKAITWASASTPTFNASGTTTCDLSASNVCKISFTGTGSTTTLALTNPHGSGPYQLESCQSSTGGGTYTFPGTAIGFVQPDPGTGTTNCTWQGFTYDGTNYNATDSSVPSSPWRGVGASPVAFSNFPTCNSGRDGTIGFITDSTTTVLGATVTGGGSGHIEMYCNGTNWIVVSASSASASGSTTVNGQTCTLGSSCTIPLSAVNAQTTTYQVLAADFSNYKTISVASGTFTVTLVATGSQPAAGQYINVVNYGSGVVTIARSGQNINGGTGSIVLPAAAATTPVSATIWSDGTNYIATDDIATIAQISGLGTNVAAFLATPSGANLASALTSAIPQSSISPVDLTSGTSKTFSLNAGYFECTGTCTITMPVPAAGKQYCVRNANNVATVITFAAIGSSSRYENTASTAYGTAGTGTLVSGGAVGDKICLVGFDSTHYNVYSFNGTWTAN